MLDVHRGVRPPRLQRDRGGAGDRGGARAAERPYVITPQEFAARLPQIIWQLDDPMADAAAIRALVRRQGGAPAREGGACPARARTSCSAGTACTTSRAWCGRRPGCRAGGVTRRRRWPPGYRPGSRARGCSSGSLRRCASRYIGNANVFSGAEVDVLTRYGGGTVYDVTDPFFDQAASAGLDDVATMQLVDINTWLPGDILVKADRAVDGARAGAAHAVPRPRGDGGGQPAGAGGEDRRGHHQVRAARSGRRRCCRRRPRSGASSGFPVPIGHWFRGELSGYAEQVIREARTEEWLDKRAVIDVLRRFRAGDPDVPWRRLWTLRRVLALAPDLRGAGLRPGRARLGVLTPAS